MMIRNVLFISLLLLFTPAFVFAQSGPFPKPGSVSVESFPVYKDSDGDPATAIIDADDRVVLSAEGGIESVTDKLGELLAGTASETVLLDKLDEIKNNLGTDTNILDKLDSLIESTASETVLVDKLTELKAAIAATASETRLIAAINAAATRDITHITQRNITLTPYVSSAIITTLTAPTRTFIEIQPRDPSAVYWLSMGSAAVVGTSRYCQGTFYAEFAKATSVHVIASEALTIRVIEGGR